jgi:hypothetical protein
MEITEDAEEGGPPVKEEATASPPSQDAEKRRSQMSDATAVPPKDENTPEGDAAENPEDSRADTASVHTVSRRKFLDQLAQQPYEPRKSTQSMRPSLQELDYAASYRQKVKLGPRPSVDIGGRPRTAGSMSRSHENRPVAALPAGLRSSSSRKSQGTSSRPKSHHDVPMPSLASLKNVPPVPLLIPPPTVGITRPQLSPGAKSMTAVPSSGMSPEKQRLMKALELRKKQMEKRTQELQRKQKQQKTGTEQPAADVSENKENIDHTVEKTILESKDHADMGSKDADPLPTHSQKPMTAGSDDLKQPSVDSSKRASAVEVVVVTFNASPNPELSKVPDSAPFHDKIPASTGPEPEPEPEPEQTQAAENGVPQEEKASPDSHDEPGDHQPLDLTASVVTTAVLDDTPEAHHSVPESEDIPAAAENAEGTFPEQVTLQQQDQVVGEDEDRERTPTASEPAPLVDHHETFTESSDSHEIEQREHEVAERLETPAEGLPSPAVSDTEVSRGISMADESAPKAEESAVNAKHRRIALLEPIQVTAPDFSDEDNLLSDDSFLEELKSATVQEAKPVSVGKTPFSPYGEPRTPLEAWKSRATSNPSGGSNELHALPVGDRSVSATYFDDAQPVRPVPVVMAKKVNVSSGISKRIKALEMFSNNRDSVSNIAPSAPATTAAAPSGSAFDKFRKRASLSMSGGVPSAPPSARSSLYETSPPSPESMSTPPVPSRHESRTRSKRNSVSVTARIVRDPSTLPTDLNANPLESSVLNLQRSPLTVEQDPPETVSFQGPLLHNNDEQGSYATPSELSRRSSVDTTIASRNGVSSPRSRMDEKLARSATDLSSSPEEKRESRKSRLMRRMSSLASPRKSVISPSSSISLERHLPTPQLDQDLHPEPPQVVDIGEVNVQFPDTLLWKRRFLRIDDQGYLILTPGNVDSGTRNMVKRYHLSEFNPPCLPDEDRQELPNSILLDFRNGSTLQCACESRKGQAAVLQSKSTIHHLLGYR